MARTECNCTVSTLEIAVALNTSAKGHPLRSVPNVERVESVAAELRITLAGDWAGRPSVTTAQARRIVDEIRQREQAQREEAQREALTRDNRSAAQRLMDAGHTSVIGGPRDMSKSF